MWKMGLPMPTLKLEALFMDDVAWGGESVYSNKWLTQKSLITYSCLNFLVDVIQRKVYIYVGLGSQKDINLSAS